MLSLVHVQNFRCLRNARLELEPLTVLVGPNGSGKTALLDALRRKFKVRPGDLWQGQQDLIMRREVILSPGTPPLTKTAAIGQWMEGTWNEQRLELLPNQLRKHNPVAEERQLERDGSNLSNVIESLGRRRQEALSQRLCELVPLFSDLDVLPLQSRPGTKRIVFYDRWKSKVRYEPEQVSDGTMLVLAFLTLAFLEDGPDLLTIESPEHSLHPYLLAQVMALLRSLSEGKLGPKPTQVVIATHSSGLLEFVHPHEVRFVSRDLGSGETIVNRAPTETDEFKQAWKAYDESLGELWLSGGLGGVPAPVDFE